MDGRGPRSLRWICVVAGALALVLIGGSGSASAQAPIEGTWEVGGGAIEVTQAPPPYTGWIGTVAKPTNLAGCKAGKGTVLWAIYPGLDDYDYYGTHEWVSPLDCSPVGSGGATFRISYLSRGPERGTPQLRLCTTDPLNEHNERCFDFNQVVDDLVVRDEELCSPHRQNQWRIAHFRGQTELVHYTADRQTISRQVVDTWPIGSFRIGAATCRKRHGRWGILQPFPVKVDSVGLNDEAGPRQPKQDSAEGWGLGIRRVGRDFFQIQLMFCHRTLGFWGLVRELNSVPVPKVDFRISLVQYALGKLILDRIPDQVHCFDWGIQELKLSVQGRGRLTLEPGFDTTEIATQESPGPGGTIYSSVTTVHLAKVVARG